MMKIVENPKFDMQEFSERWYRARVSALRELLQQHSELTPMSTEHQMLKLVTPEMQERALKGVFDNGRKFAISASRYLGMVFEISDLADILPLTGISCFSSLWREHNQAQVLERKGCHSLQQLSSFGCDYWREALDGLVMGLGENERLARHRSMGHGDADCLDVLYSEQAPVPKVLSHQHDSEHRQSSNLKFGVIPQPMLQQLQPIQQRFESMKATLTFEGLSERTLFYRLEGEQSVLCGVGAKLMHDILKRDLAKIYPDVHAKDTTPQAVYGGST